MSNTQIEKIVDAFLYSPIDSSKIKLTCFCGEELKLIGYGNSFREGSGEAVCKNNHALILAHKFVNKSELPRYCDSFDFIFKITRFEDEICAYCNKPIGSNVEWQRELIDRSRAVHKDCHYEKVFQVIKSARKYTNDWNEISDILSKEHLEYSTKSYTRLMYHDMLVKKIEDLTLKMEKDEMQQS